MPALAREVLASSGGWERVQVERLRPSPRARVCLSKLGARASELVRPDRDRVMASPALRATSPQKWRGRQAGEAPKPGQASGRGEEVSRWR